MNPCIAFSISAALATCPSASTDSGAYTTPYTIRFAASAFRMAIAFSIISAPSGSSPAPSAFAMMLRPFFPAPQSEM